MESLQLKISRSGARKVLEHPEIIDTISEDDGELDMPEKEHIYLCGYDHDHLVGCFIMHKQNKTTIECHVQVIPKYRVKMADEFGDAVIQWMWDHTDAEKCVAQIPFKYPNVKEFALARGFKVEGINRGSYRKNGELFDQWYMGIRRWDS